MRFFFVFRFTLAWALLFGGTSAVSRLRAQDERAVAHRLESVKVYLDRAQLTHVGSTDVTAGQTALVFSGVSPLLDGNSLRVRGSASAGTSLVILSVASRVSYLPQARQSDRIERLRDSIRSTQRRIVAQNDKLFVLHSEEKLLLENIKVAGDAGVNITTLDLLAQRYRTRLSELRSTQRTEEHAREALDELLSRLKGDLSQTEIQPALATHQVVVTVEAKAPGRANLTLDYLAGGASWRPEYDLRLEKVGEPILLDVRAQVANATGVDWAKVPLTLTTAQANVSATAPQLSPQYLRELIVLAREMLLRKSMAPRAAAAEMRVADTAEADHFGDSDEEVGTAADLSTALQGQLALDFAIAARYDIPSDSRERQVAVAQHRLPAEVSHFAVPKLDKDVFLVANVSGFDGLGLLPGMASVYLEDAFVARTAIDPNQTRDTLRVGLGRDPRLQLKREAVREFTSRKVLGGSVRLNRGFTIELRNARADAVTLTLEDQLPVSQDQRIRVRSLDLGGASLDPATGKLTWQLSLKPGERRTLRFSYEVEHPRELNVQGL